MAGVKKGTLNWRRRGETTSAANALPFTIQNVAMILKKHQGNLTEVAREMKTTRSIVKRKIDINPALLHVFNEIRQERIDKVEQALYEQAEAGNMTAIALVLKTVGRDRGYGEHSTVEHDISAMHNSAQLIEEMRKGAKQIEMKNEVVEGEYIWVPTVESQEQTS